METYTIQFTQQETSFIYQTFEQVPFAGPQAKAVAAAVQAKIESATPDPEPESAEAGDVVE